MKRTHQEYAPLTAKAVKRILEFDRERGFGPGGTEPNRNRFYHWLVQNGSDVQIRTVAVKAKRNTQQPLVKEVARASVDDPHILIRDVAHVMIAGYVVDWSPEGIGQSRGWDYRGRWEVAGYKRRCMFKINAPVVNHELLKKTRRFKWSAWTPENGHLLDYLKVYREHPEIEFLSKCGLGRLCTKLSLVLKLKVDRQFRQFFSRNVDAIRNNRHFNVPVILKAYSKGISFGEASKQIGIRQWFHGYCLPRSICAQKAMRYINKRGMSRSQYTDYLHNCQKLDLNLADTKVSFPKNFNDRRQAVQDRIDAIIRAENAVKFAEMNRQLAGIAKKWSRLARNDGAYRIVIPQSEQEFKDEGKGMANCLGQYADRVARGECVVVFVHQSSRPEEAFVAAAYDPKRKIVTQCYGVKNSNPSKKVRDFVESVFAGKAAVKLKVAA